MGLIFVCGSRDTYRKYLLTMTSVQELSNDGSAAHRPRPAPVNLNQRWRHHVIVLQFPKYLITCLHIVMGHVEDMT